MGAVPDTYGQGVAFGPQDAPGGEHTGRPAADPGGPAFPLAHELRVHAEAAGVEEAALGLTRGEPAHVDPDGVAPRERAHQITGFLHAEVQREVVEGAAGEHGEREAVAQGHAGRRVHRAVAAAHAEDAGAGGRLLQLGAHFGWFALDGLRAGERVREGVYPVPGRRALVHDDHEPGAVAERGREGFR